MGIPGIIGTSKHRHGCTRREHRDSEEQRYQETKGCLGNHLGEPSEFPGHGCCLITWEPIIFNKTVPRNICMLNIGMTSVIW